MSTILAELDLLTPFEIWEIPLDNGAYIKFHQPLVLQPEWMPDDPEELGHEKYLRIEHLDLGISAWGRTRKEIWSSVSDDIRFSWKHFASARDVQLAPDAKAMKDYYLTIAEVVDG